MKPSNARQKVWVIKRGFGFIGQVFFITGINVVVATDDAPSCEVPSRRRTIKPPAWQKDYYMF